MEQTQREVCEAAAKKAKEAGEGVISKDGGKELV